MQLPRGWLPWTSRAELQITLWKTDIPQGRVYTYEPSSGTTGFETFPDQVTFIALREDQPGVRHSSFAFALNPH